MLPFEIVAHRGAPLGVPENTIPAFERALELGADATELDVRLTKDGIPVVFHHFYLDEGTNASGPIFQYTFEQLQAVEVLCEDGDAPTRYRIPTLQEVLEEYAGRIGWEIEIKGPEPEAAEFVASVLRGFRHQWDTMEVTSYEPTLLAEIHDLCPGLPTDLILPRSQDWMKLDVVAYLAVHRARLAGASAVHLHPTQLSSDLVSTVRSAGLEVHSCDANNEDSLSGAAELGIPKICTDRLEWALELRDRLGGK
jgi:glycerophosphoryl diester phosphodiesterase